MDAYECYMLNEDLEPTCRAVYYYETHTGKHAIILHEQDKKTKTKVYSIIPIEDDDTIEETITKADACDGVTMGDIC